MMIKVGELVRIKGTNIIGKVVEDAFCGLDFVIEYDLNGTRYQERLHYNDVHEVIEVNHE